MATQHLQAALTILRRKQVEIRTGLSRSTIYSKIKSERLGEHDPTFPKPIKLGGKAVGWIESEIEAWINAQIQKSRKA